MTGLLEPDFLRRLQALRHLLLSEARSGAMGADVARRRGASSEFREHRRYVAGDDPRRVDWMAYARTGEPVIKLYQSEEDTLMRVLVDASASLGFGEPQKIQVLRRLAAALAYLALASSRRAQIVIGHDPGDRSPGISTSGPRRGRQGYAQLCHELENIQPSGRTNLTELIDTTLRRSTRPGLLVVLSDFLDPGQVPAALRRARAAGHDLVLIQVLDPSELAPDFEGDLSLEDSETGDQIQITMDFAAREAYELRLAGLLEELRAFARQHGITYVRVRTTDDLESPIRRVLSRAVD